VHDDHVVAVWAAPTNHREQVCQASFAGLFPNWGAVARIPTALCWHLEIKL